MSGLSKQEFEATVDQIRDGLKVAVAERMRQWAERLTAAIGAIDFEEQAEAYLDGIDWSISGVDDGEVCQHFDDAAKTAIDEAQLD